MMKQARGLRLVCRIVPTCQNFRQKKDLFSYAQLLYETLLVTNMCLLGDRPAHPFSV
jgi:hypothetical protein